MRRLFIFLFLLSFLSSVSSAHPGRTDANGGHWDRSTGEYHFHTGEYAGRSSSGSSSKSSYDNFEPPYDPPTENPYRNKTIAERRRERLLEEKEKDESESRKFLIACSCYSIFVLFYLWCSESPFFKG